MNEAVLPFLLILATIVGSAIAVLLVRQLDKGSRRDRKVIALKCPDKSEVIDLSDRNILLAPKGKQKLINRLVERELTVSNIGFATVSDFCVKVVLTMEDSENERKVVFSEVTSRVYPDGLAFELVPVKVEDTRDEFLLKYKFMNRGDYHSLRLTADKDFQLQVSGHEPGVQFISVRDIAPLPTLRQKIGNIVGNSKSIEMAGAIVAAAAIAWAVG